MTGLDGLLGKAEALDGAAAPEPASEAPEAVGASQADSADELRPILVPLVGVVANEVCSRRRLTRLEDQETGLLADALINLADAYDLKVKDPKVAAWLGLGAAAALIYKNRQRLPEPVAADAAAAA